MTEHEYLIHESIRMTMARYAIAADAADYGELAQCFCSNGTLTVVGGLALAGREAISTELGRRAKARGHGTRTDIFQRHFLGTSYIVVRDGAARATTYYHVITETGSDHAGRYFDRFTRCGTEWLLLSRNATMDWINPASRFAAFTGGASDATHQNS